MWFWWCIRQKCRCRRLATFCFNGFSPLMNIGSLEKRERKVTKRRVTEKVSERVDASSKAFVYLRAVKKNQNNGIQRITITAKQKCGKTNEQHLPSLAVRVLLYTPSSVCVSVWWNACMFLFGARFSMLSVLFAGCVLVQQSFGVLKRYVQNSYSYYHCFSILHRNFPCRINSNSSSSSFIDGNNLLNACQKLRVYLCLVVSLVFQCLVLSPRDVHTTHF